MYIVKFVVHVSSQVSTVTSCQVRFISFTVKSPVSHFAQSHLAQSHLAQTYLTQSHVVWNPSRVARNFSRVPWRKKLSRPIFQSLVNTPKWHILEVLKVPIDRNTSLVWLLTLPILQKIGQKLISN